jgi:N-acetylneuraminic acid mutarotase
MKWTQVGSLTQQRIGHTANLLQNGKVLIAGGGEPEGTAELYDPGTGNCSLTGSPFYKRTGAAGLNLPNNRVLEAGGIDQLQTTNQTQLATVELYNPETGEWNSTSSLNTPRGLHGSVSLSDGRAMVIGGYAERVGGILGSCEIYDPTTLKWTETGSLNVPRFYPIATLLADGRVLVVGGAAVAGNTPELYDPQEGTWRKTTEPHYPRLMPSLTLLPDGNVLLVGGASEAGFLPFGSVEIFHPAVENWFESERPAVPRSGHVAVRLNDGRVLIHGGYDREGNPLASAELYIPSQFTWSSAGNSSFARARHTLTLLKHRFIGLSNPSQVLVAGGTSNICEVFDSSEIVVK